jgi:hypothetical protein
MCQVSCKVRIFTFDIFKSPFRISLAKISLQLMRQAFFPAALCNQPETFSSNRMAIALFASVAY